MPLSERLTPNADGSVSLSEGGTIAQVGVLATDAQHGARGGGGIHTDATSGSAGFMSAADKVNLNGIVAGTIAGSAYFGLGVDGAISLGTVSITRPVTQATTFTATGNVTPETGSPNRNGTIIRATTSITINGGASINADGRGGVGSAGGAAGANGSAVAAASQTNMFADPAQVTGGNGGTGGVAGAQGTVGDPGSTGNQMEGGSGAGGGGGGGGTVAAGNNGGNGGLQTAGNAFDSHITARMRWDPLSVGTSGAPFIPATVNTGAGGAGGGGGGAGGGPGGAGGAGASGAGVNGGGWLFLCAPSVTGTGRISANGTVGVNGTNGSNSALQGGGGGGGGSGGGSGGYVKVIAKSIGGGLTIQANGATGGSGGNGGTAGAGAAAGRVGGLGGTGGAGVVESNILP
jgi:hypothetical protein